MGLKGGKTIGQCEIRIDRTKKVKKRTKSLQKYTNYKELKKELIPQKSQQTIQRKRERKIN